MADEGKVILSFEEFVGGWLGGIGGLLVSHPIDTMKVHLQHGKGTLLDTIKVTYKTEGILGFYKGIGFPSMMAGIQNAVFFGMYANIYRLLQRSKYGQNPDYEFYRIVVAGMCGGLIQVMSTTPVEIIKIKLQTVSKATSGPKHTILSTMRRIYSLNGFRGFYHGFIPTACRDVPSGGLYIGIYSYMNRYLEQHINSYWAHVISGGLAGSLSFAPVTPFDVIKTRMQADNPEAPKFKNVRDCIQQCYAKDGVSCFWRGFWTASLRAFVGNATVFTVYEMCISYLK